MLVFLLLKDYAVMCKCLWGVLTSHPSCGHPGLGQLVHTVGTASGRWGTSSLISIVGPPVYISTSSASWLPFAHIL